MEDKHVGCVIIHGEVLCGRSLSRGWASIIRPLIQLLILLHSALAGQRGHQRVGPAAERAVVVAGARSAQRRHHRVRDQVL